MAVELKGFYTLGVLKEVEALIGRPLCERFDLVFGTSTGAIIAALVALGKTVDDIHTLYKDHVPTVMRARRRAAKSAALKYLADTIFDGARFEDVKTALGIVATRWDFERPMIFKASVAQAHGSKATFVPGFGCTMSDAVQASWSAYPFFDRKILKTRTGDRVELIDGGYCANNPTLYAIADAVMALKKDYADLRVISVGVGIYPGPARSMWKRMIGRLESVRLLQKTLNINTLSMEQLRTVLFKQVPTVRISDTFEKPEMKAGRVGSSGSLFAAFSSWVRQRNLLDGAAGSAGPRFEPTMRKWLRVKRVTIQAVYRCRQPTPFSRNPARVTR